MSEGTQRQTVTNQPPGFLLSGLTTAANAALGQSGLGGFQPQQLTQPLTRRDFRQQKKLARQSRKLGIPFTPNLGSSGFNPGAIIGGPIDTNFQPAGGNTANPAAGLLDQSSDLISRTLRGEFLTPDSNPFLQQTFDRAADLTRNRLATEFAGSGRNLAASAPARSEELQTLAASIFGNNFQTERGRQLGVIGQAQGLDPTNLLINRIAGITPGAGGVTTSRTGISGGSGEDIGIALAALQTAAMFSDRRLKENIEKLGEFNGHIIYRWTWNETARKLGVDGPTFGVMADEIPQEFVSQRNGFDFVDYGRLLFA